ncbi:MAG: alpha/beta hydrolase-fold protein [Acidobacteriota bacterium]
MRRGRGWSTALMLLLTVGVGGAWIARTAAARAPDAGPSTPPPGTPLPAPPLPADAAALDARLDALGAIVDDASREIAIDALWNALVEAGQVPWRDADGAVRLLYRAPKGAALPTAVGWVGDLSGWRPANALDGARVGRSRIWRRPLALPSDARLDYKLMLNGSIYAVDPANPLTQLGGYGPNNVLQMPAYAPPTAPVARDDVPKGALHDWQTLPFAATRERGPDGRPPLPSTLRYRVYVPADYDADAPARHPVLYLTDGTDYAHPEMGGLVTTLDNLIADGRIPPTLAVFLDPNDLRADENRRDDLFLHRAAFYRTWIIERVVPAVDTAYRTRATRDGRSLIGTSYGGVFATDVALSDAGAAAFGRFGVHSPAYWADGELLDGRLAAAVVAPSAVDRLQGARFFFSTGTFNDGLTTTRQVIDALRAAGATVVDVEVNDGHSWGHWRATMARMVETLVATAAAVDAEPQSAPAQGAHSGEF